MKTGIEYRQSLRDNRETFFEGHQVEDLEAEPALAVAVDQVAHGYDKYYSSAPDARNPLIEAPRSPEQMRERIPLLHEVDLVLNVTYQSLMTLLTAAPKIEKAAPDCYERIQQYVEQAIREDIRITECITDAKGNR